MGSKKNPNSTATAKQIKGRWYGYYRDESGKQRLVEGGGVATKEEAVLRAREVERTVGTQAYRDSRKGKMTFKTYAETVWWPHHRLRIEISTQEGYWGKLQTHLIPAFGHLRMEQIRYTTIQTWVTEKQHEGMGVLNLIGVVRVLRLILKAAVRDEVMLNNPATLLELPTPPRRDWCILKPEQADAFDAAVSKLSMKWQAFLFLEMETGCRFSELRALRPRHLDELRSRVHVCETVMDTSPKWLDENLHLPRFKDYVRINDRWYMKPFTKDGNKEGHGSRVIGIEPAVMKLVLRYIEEQGIGPDDLIFLSDGGKRGPGGQPIHNSDFHADIWKPLLAAAGLPENMRPHDLRHTVASWALNGGGASLRDVMEIMGHSQIATTQLYSHPLDDAPDNVLEARRKARQKKRDAS